MIEQRPPALLVVERDVFKADVSAHVLDIAGVGAIAEMLLDVENFEDLVERNRCLSDRAVDGGEPLDGSEQAANVAEEGDHRSDRDLTFDDQVSADSDAGD